MGAKPAFEGLQQTMWRLNAEVAVRSNGANSALFTGPRGGEGASTLALALACGAARYDGIRVLLIDADFAKASLTLAENLRTAAGLRDWQAGQPLPANALRNRPGVDLMPTGRDGGPTMPVLVKSGHIEALHSAAAQTYGLVVWDAPPLMTAPDAAMLAPRVDGVFLVVWSGRSLMSDLTQSVDEITGVNGRLASVVRNRAYKGNLGY